MFSPSRVILIFAGAEIIIRGSWFSGGLLLCGGRLVDPLRLSFSSHPCSRFDSIGLKKVVQFLFYGHYFQRRIRIRISALVKS